MKLLILTQIVDKNDTNLGFFHAWIAKLAAKTEHVSVICLKKGEYDLPKNVSVFSLGKEEKVSKIQYIFRLYKYIIGLRKDYDTVFVHMNPEYAILGGIFWKMWKKPIVLWYTHRAVNMRLYIAEKLVTKIFTASSESLRIKTKKKEVVGHGIMIENITQAKEETLVGKGTLKILTVGRISRVKNIEKIIDTAIILKEKNIPFILDIIGPSITDDDREYKKCLLSQVESAGLDNMVHFKDAIPHEEIIRQYASHHLFVHTSATGSLDKVVLEAFAAGLIVFTTSDVVYEGSSEEFLVKLPPKALGKDIAEAIEKRYISGILIPTKKGREYVKNNHNLDKIIDCILSFFRATI